MLKSGKKDVRNLVSGSKSEDLRFRKNKLVWYFEQSYDNIIVSRLKEYLAFEINKAVFARSQK
jgi:hypothetical protein